MAPPDSAGPVTSSAAVVVDSEPDRSGVGYRAVIG